MEDKKEINDKDLKNTSGGIEIDRTDVIDKYKEKIIEIYDSLKDRKKRQFYDKDKRRIRTIKTRVWGF